MPTNCHQIPASKPAQLLFLVRLARLSARFGEDCDNTVREGDGDAIALRIGKPKGFPEVGMRTRALVAGAIFFQIICTPQPVRGQMAASEPAYPLIILKTPMEAIPPIQYPLTPLPPPFSPKIATAVRANCCSGSQPVQVDFANGTFWKGEVIKLIDSDSFDFRRRGSRKMERIHYRDVVAVTSIGPGFEEVAGKVGLYAGLVAMAVLLFPFIFAMGLGCNFHCS